MTRSLPALEARPPPRIVGILNLTPDSFSDGGRFAEPRSAIAHALRMVQEGADVIDVGGESTRPGSLPVAAAEQARRVLRVIEGLRTRLPPHVPISIDTTRADVAEAALGAGASLINDVSAGRHDPRMFGVAAASGVPLVLMHMQGTPATMQQDPRYEDVVEEVRAFLLERARAAEAAGIAPQNLIIDPGIGFGKTRRAQLDPPGPARVPGGHGLCGDAGREPQALHGLGVRRTRAVAIGGCDLRHDGARGASRGRVVPGTRRRAATARPPMSPTPSRAPTKAGVYRRNATPVA